jgi:hypothetical protein
MAILQNSYFEINWLYFGWSGLSFFYLKLSCHQDADDIVPLADALVGF